ncbi:TM2 domain-containing protein [Gottfriedia solisilvae]|uniref:TM2 domain-containing protein n=1 Tax=Gottfriedia solisilvae TaxID=1516104 RepID=A0A8J3EYM2_9BACI|nr:TM2 domain-containing protein [Gottfriedia solisilvae]GGI16145.1 hypothetical protein GCM10007380_31500 [Gottfriedia solisilvae]
MSGFNSKINKRDLTLEELGFLESEMLKKMKSKDAAWGLWAGLHFFGAHRFYTEDYKYGSAMFLSIMLPLIAIIFLFFTDTVNLLFYISLCLIVCSLLWSWIDAFFLNSRLNQFNETVEQTILENIRENRNA